MLNFILQALFQSAQHIYKKREGSGARSVPLTNGSESGRPKNMRILRIRIPNTSLIKKKRKSFLCKEIQKGEAAKSYMTNGICMIRLKICSFPHILGSPSSYMTLQLLPSEFPYIYEEKFSFLFYQCGWMERKTNLLGGRAEAGAGGGGGGTPGRRGGQPTETESGCRTGRETSGEEQANPGKNIYSSTST